MEQPKSLQERVNEAVNNQASLAESSDPESPINVALLNVKTDLSLLEKNIIELSGDSSMSPEKRVNRVTNATVAAKVRPKSKALSLRPSPNDGSKPNLLGTVGSSSSLKNRSVEQTKKNIERLKKEQRTAAAAANKAENQISNA